VICVPFELAARSEPHQHACLYEQEEDAYDDEPVVLVVGNERDAPYT
jgi:hypothetical protein